METMATEFLNQCANLVQPKMAEPRAELELIIEQSHGAIMAGDTLAGVIIVTIASPIALEQLFLDVKGEAKTSWVNKTSDKIYESTEIYINQVVNLSQFADPVIPAGRTNVPFQFALPAELPSSFDGEFGRIVYSMKVVILTPDRQKPITACERFFSLVARLNLSQIPITKHPVEAVDATDFSCCCIPIGTVQATIQIPRNGYLPNETISISGMIYNGSRKQIEACQFSLVQHARFKAMSRYENAEDTKEMKYVLSMVSKGSIQANRTMRITALELAIPPVIPTYQGNILQISYMLRFEADPGIEIEIPITLGTRND